VASAERRGADDAAMHQPCAHHLVKVGDPIVGAQIRATLDDMKDHHLLPHGDQPQVDGGERADDQAPKLRRRIWHRRSHHLSQPLLNDHDAEVVLRLVRRQGGRYRLNAFLAGSPQSLKGQRRDGCLRFGAFGRVATNGVGNVGVA